MVEVFVELAALFSSSGHLQQVHAWLNYGVFEYMKDEVIKREA